ncbi:TOMM precursor leader peptide-binding protein [Yoonia sp. BS5-3]|uniref:TOMM leader peptide-binding protein n=1 Tax=Yoonia phaeophyticola TaxID=3137369 RepID=A0ABZ2V5S5_9RHOB
MDANGEEGLRIVSRRRSITLKGKAFEAFEDRVIPLLTGLHTVEEICDQVSDIYRADDVIAALGMLSSQGFLVDGEQALAAGNTPGMAPQRGWLAENTPGGSAAQGKLSAARIVLFGAGLHGAVAGRALVAAGIGQLTIVDPVDVSAPDLYFSHIFNAGDIGKNRASALASALAQATSTTRIEAVPTRPDDASAMADVINGASLVIGCLDAGELNLSFKLDAACRQTGTPWVSASLEGTELVVGPGFFNPKGPCLMCWRMREVATSENPASQMGLERQYEQWQRDLSMRRENLAPAADIAGGILAAEVITLLSGTCTPNLDGRFLTITIPGFRVEKHIVLRKPDCPVCGPSG